MRVATFNLWHGLSPSNVVAFEALEPSGRKTLREKLQLETLKTVAADCICLQEVNPAREKAAELSGQLGYAFTVQPDLTGIKLLGYGPPFNLSSGLVEMTIAPLKYVRSEQLSGPRSTYVSRFFSWQLKESRYALFSEVNLENFGRTLLINTHLHHGLESDEALLKEMGKVCKDLDLSEVARDDLQERLLAGNLRREQEVGVLLKAIEEIQSRYEMVIVCGDFNCVPGSSVYHKMVEAGFSDAWMEIHPEAPGYTFDPTVNSANYILQERFPSSMILEDLTFSAVAKDALAQLVRHREARSRRIDYVWFRTKTGSACVKNAALFGLPNAEGLAPSDHFGVSVDLERV